jgi:hypothetical protein
LGWRAKQKAKGFLRVEPWPTNFEPPAYVEGIEGIASADDGGAANPLG